MKQHTVFHWIRAGLLMLMLSTATKEVSGQMDDEMAELAAMLRENCAGETGADVSIVEAVNGGALLRDNPDPKFKCYIKCVLETAGMMSEGEINVETVIAMLPENVQRNGDLLRACGIKKGADDCETAFLTNVCWQESVKTDYFLV